MFEKCVKFTHYVFNFLGFWHEGNRLKIRFVLVKMQNKGYTNIQLEQKLEFLHVQVSHACEESQNLRRKRSGMCSGF